MWKSPETSSLTLIRTPGAIRSQRNSGTGLALEQCCLPPALAQAAESGVASGAAVRATTAEEVIRVARSILQDAGLRERMGKAGVAFCAAHRGATERTLAICERLLR